MILKNLMESMIFFYLKILNKNFVMHWNGTTSVCSVSAGSAQQGKGNVFPRTGKTGRNASAIRTGSVKGLQGDSRHWCEASTMTEEGVLLSSRNRGF